MPRVTVKMEARPSLIGYILFNVGLYLFHLPSQWWCILILLLFSLFCILHHLFDPDYILFEKWVLLLMTMYMNVFLYLYLFHLDIMYTRLRKYAPDFKYDANIITVYIVSIQVVLVSSIIIIFATANRVSRSKASKKLYLV